MPEGLSATVTIEGLSELRQRLPDEARTRRLCAWIAQSYGNRLLKEIVDRVPRRTSNTAHTVKVTPSGADGLEVTVGSESPVFRWLEEGTGIYGPMGQRIYPKNARVLAWPTGTFGPEGSLRLTGRPREGAAGAGSGMAFATSIAGMQAHHFIATAMDAAQSYLGDLLSRAAQLAFDAGMLPSPEGSDGTG
jgi:hypothetical protein